MNAAEPSDSFRTPTPDTVRGKLQKDDWGVSTCCFSDSVTSITGASFQNSPTSVPTSCTASPALAAWNGFVVDGGYSSSSNGGRATQSFHGNSVCNDVADGLDFDAIFIDVLDTQRHLGGDNCGANGLRRPHTMQRFSGNEDETLLAMLSDLAQGAPHHGAELPFSEDVVRSLPLALQCQDPLVKANCEKLREECNMARDEIASQDETRRRLEAEVDSMRKRRDQQCEESNTLRERVRQTKQQLVNRLTGFSEQQISLRNQVLEDRRANERLKESLSADVEFLSARAAEVSQKITEVGEVQTRLVSEFRDATELQAQLQSELQRERVAGRQEYVEVVTSLARGGAPRTALSTLQPSSTSVVLAPLGQTTAENHQRHHCEVPQQCDVLGDGIAEDEEISGDFKEMLSSHQAVDLHCQSPQGSCHALSRDPGTRPSSNVALAGSFALLRDGASFDNIGVLPVGGDVSPFPFDGDHAYARTFAERLSWPLSRETSEEELSYLKEKSVIESEQMTELRKNVASQKTIGRQLRQSLEALEESCKQAVASGLLAKCGRSEERDVVRLTNDFPCQSAFFQDTDAISFAHQASSLWEFELPNKRTLHELVEADCNSAKASLEIEREDLAHVADALTEITLVSAGAKATCEGQFQLLDAIDATKHELASEEDVVMKHRTQLRSEVAEHQKILQRYKSMAQESTVDLYAVKAGCCRRRQARTVKQPPLGDQRQPDAVSPTRATNTGNVGSSTGLQTQSRSTTQICQASGANASGAMRAMRAHGGKSPGTQAHHDTKGSNDALISGCVGVEEETSYSSREPLCGRRLAGGQLTQLATTGTFVDLEEGQLQQQVTQRQREPTHRQQADVAHLCFEDQEVLSTADSSWTAADPSEAPRRISDDV